MRFGACKAALSSDTRFVKTILGRSLGVLGRSLGMLGRSLGVLGRSFGCAVWACWVGWVGGWGGWVGGWVGGWGNGACYTRGATKLLVQLDVLCNVAGEQQESASTYIHTCIHTYKHVPNTFRTRPEHVPSTPRTSPQHVLKTSHTHHEFVPNA